MKKIYAFNLLIFLFAAASLHAQVQVYHQGIAQSNVNFRGAPVTLAQETITTTEAGTVVVRFDGYGIVDVGDRLVIAASDTDDWTSNSGNVGIEAYNSDQNRRTFSHTRTYDVAAGTHTFYAVGENWVEQDGDGMASVYGSLTTKFYPSSGTNARVKGIAIEQTGVNVRGSATSLGSLDIDAPVAGTVVVNFDGSCVSDAGDRIILAANEAVDWSPNNGQCSVEAFDSDLNTTSFSHSRSYDVSAGTHTFYAVAENLVETSGSGEISVYGQLTAEFFPDTIGDTKMDLAEIVSTNTDVRTAVVSLADIDFDVPADGKVLVHFNGYGIMDVGDRLIVAANNIADWVPNDGQVGIEAVDNDVNRQPFSHTRMFDVSPGMETFYAVAHNWVEQDGSGVASIYGNLTMQYFPNTVTTDIDGLSSKQLQYGPNPSDGLLELRLSGFAERSYDVQVLDLQGRVLHKSELGVGTDPSTQLDLRHLAAGIYVLRLSDGKASLSRKLVIQ